MRTKNLNLKKKLAFIASVAMIASTAAYLPADFAKDIGVNVGIVAEATDPAPSYSGSISTFEAYIKVNNRYIANKGGTFKFYRTMDEVKADDALTYLLTLSDDANFTNASAKAQLVKGNYDSSVDAKTYNEKYTVDTTAVINLPVDVEAGSTITVEVAAKSDAAIASSTNTVDVTLDAHGMATVGTQTNLIEVQGDNYNPSAQTHADDENREFIDLSGLKFEVKTDTYGSYKGFTSATNSGKQMAFSATTSGTAKIEKYNASKDGSGFAEVVANNPTEGAEKSYEYALVADGKAWARNFVGTLNAEAAPGTTIAVDLGIKNNWTVSGASISTRASDGHKILNLTLGSDGTVTSGVITVSKDDVVEKFVITVLNHASGVDPSKITLANGAFKTSEAGVALNETTAYVPASGSDSAVPAKSFKFTPEKKVLSVNGNNEFVTVYTVANNNTDTTKSGIEFNVNTESGGCTNGVFFAEATGTEGYIIVKGEAGTDGNAGKYKYNVTKTLTSGNTVLKTATFTTTGYYDNDITAVSGFNVTTTTGSGESATTSTTNEVTSHNYGVYKTIEVKPETGKGANAKSQVLRYDNATTGSMFQLDITTTYYIDVDENNYTGSSTPVYAKAKVVGRTITKPDESTKPGYKFNSFWDTNATPGSDPASGNKIFAAGIARQQTDSVDVINPNMKLYAIYESNSYNVVLDANGGYFADTLPTDGGYTKTNFDAKDRPIELTVTRTALNDTGVLTDYTKSKSNITKEGYELAGWATKADATEDEIVTSADFETIRPSTANGTMKLYAVWKAVSYQVNWGYLALKTDGTNADETITASYIDTAPDWQNGVAPTTMYIKTGEAFGDLPTPVKKGYEFVGWYLKKDTTPLDDSDNKFSASLVTSSTKLSYDDLEGGSLKLYAKFRQAKYNITFDLDGGEFKGATGSSFKPVAYYKINGYSNAVEFYAEDNTKLTLSDDYNAKKGSGSYYKFKGYTIGTSTEVISDATGIADKIKNLNAASNLTIKAVYEQASNVSGQGYYALYTNGGQWFDYDSTQPDGKYYKSTSDSVEVKGPKNEDVAEKFESNIVTEDNGTDKYALAKPGYTFTGWYTDEACTQAFDFSTAKYPDEKEVAVYAGWKANTTTSYTLKCLLVDANGSIVTNPTNASTFPTAEIENNSKTFVGATGSTADAAKLVVTYDGKRYVFDEERSAEFVTSKKIEATWKTTDVYKTDGQFGKLGAQGTTVIYGVFAEEGSVEKPLGTATNVQAKDGTVTFTAAANADHYKVQKTWTVNGVEKTATGAAFTGTTGTYNVPTGDYKIAIVAYNADGSKSTVSAAVEVKGAAVTLGKATNLNVKDGTVTFTAAAGADHYRVQKTYTVNGTTKTAKGSKFTTTTGTFGVPEGDYKIAIIAYADAAETQFTVSDAKEVKAATIDLEAVDTASITVNRGTGEVSWTASKGAKEYVVFKIVKENGKSKIYGGRRTSETTYKFANFPTDDFKVYIASIDANENKVYSATKKISTLPSATNVKVSDDYKTVSWTKATGDKADKIVKYQVAKFDSTTNKYSYGTKVDASQSSFTLGVKAKAGQQIFVIAFDADGNSSYSDAITVK